MLNIYIIKGLSDVLVKEYYIKRIFFFKNLDMVPLIKKDVDLSYIQSMGTEVIVYLIIINVFMEVIVILNLEFNFEFLTFNHLK